MVLSRFKASLFQSIVKGIFYVTLFASKAANSQYLWAHFKSAKDLEKHMKDDADFNKVEKTLKIRKTIEVKPKRVVFPILGWLGKPLKIRKTIKVNLKKLNILAETFFESL